LCHISATRFFRLHALKPPTWTAVMSFLHCGFLTTRERGPVGCKDLEPSSCCCVTFSYIAKGLIGVLSSSQPPVGVLRSHEALFSPSRLRLHRSHAVKPPLTYVRDAWQKPVPEKDCLVVTPDDRTLRSSVLIFFCSFALFFSSGSFAYSSRPFQRVC